MNRNSMTAWPSLGASFVLAVLGAATAGSAHAQMALSTTGALSPYRGETIRPATDLSIQRASLVRPYAQVEAAGVSLPRTAIDHRFALDRLVGSAGFLCGLQPGHAENGGAAAHGFDPQGRFLGAKLRFAFR